MGPSLCGHRHLVWLGCACDHSSCSRRSCAPLQGFPLVLASGAGTGAVGSAGVAAPGLTCDMSGLTSAFPAGTAAVAAVLPGRWQDRGMGVWTVPCWGTLGCCPRWGIVLRALCCAVPGCEHLGAVSSDTGYPGVLCCAVLC